MTHYGIVGGGNHPVNIIEDGLKDIYHDDPENTLYLHCRAGASDSEKRVYGWVLDNGIPFVAITNGEAPKVLVEAADYINHSGDPEMAIIRELAANKGTLLILWDDSDQEHMYNLVLAANTLGVESKELSNGLTPFYVEEDSTTEVSTAEGIKVEEVEIDPISKEDLEDLPLSTLRKAATAQGIEQAKKLDHDELVEALADYHDEVIPNVSLNGATIPVGNSFDVPTKDASHTAMIVWYENGEMKTLEVPVTSVKALWQLT